MSSHHNLEFGGVIISTSVLSILVSLYGIAIFLKKRTGCWSLLTCIGLQIAVWDLLRSLTVGVVAGIYHLSPLTSTLPHFCTVVGPLTEISHRIPFFLVTSYTLLSTRDTQAAKYSGVGVVAFGYMMSISFAILPFLRGNSYYPGGEGFCTYYSDDVLDIDYHTTSDSDLLLYNILLSVVPFLITFIMVVVVIVVVVLCCRPKDSSSWVPSLSLVVCYGPMCGLGLTLIATYYGLATAMTHSTNPRTQEALMWLHMFAFVVLPVSTPLLTAFISAILPSGTKEESTINRKISISTTVLIQDGTPT